ncbi:helix-turn-helix domain-containing protein [Paenibacillus camelliae]|uniref:helix-turn-helix domain-containing protein n=1 Tax=Paenibacillus camelliae TaxID=512410 RepID=UPI003D818AFB|nr:helix-turn-helix domain-containing protein [Paenibacillus camelliae]
MSRFCITLRTARLLRGMTVKQVAIKTGKCVDTISKYEKDSTNIPRDLSIELIRLYNVPETVIYFGKESDLFGLVEDSAKAISI